ncbi:MAG: hypothetical protein M1833_005093 [Piccolia ochrophora]|nr:MAG: hypothetical protein M1833_005093 [Piccolia ochrophora]
MGLLPKLGNLSCFASFNVPQLSKTNCLYALSAELSDDPNHPVKLSHLNELITTNQSLRYVDLRLGRLHLDTHYSRPNDRITFPPLHTLYLDLGGLDKLDELAVFENSVQWDRIQRLRTFEVIGYSDAYTSSKESGDERSSSHEFGDYFPPTDGSDHTPALYIASSLSFVGLVRRLIENGADVDARRGPLGSALAAASSIGDLEIAQLDINGADVNAPTKYCGTNVLDLAISACCGQGLPIIEFLQLLSCYGAEFSDPKVDLVNVLGVAVAFFDRHLIKILLKQGCWYDRFGRGQSMYHRFDCGPLVHTSFSLRAPTNAVSTGSLSFRGRGVDQYGRFRVRGRADAAENMGFVKLYKTWGETFSGWIEPDDRTLREFWSKGSEGGPFMLVKV